MGLLRQRNASGIERSVQLRTIPAVFSRDRRDHMQRSKGKLMDSCYRGLVELDTSSARPSEIEAAE